MPMRRLSAKTLLFSAHSYQVYTGTLIMRINIAVFIGSPEMTSGNTALSSRWRSMVKAIIALDDFIYLFLKMFLVFFCAVTALYIEKIIN